MRSTRSEVAIIGGGIIGTTSGLTLAREGLRVTVIEPEELGTGTAHGSAGYLHDGEIYPLGRPGLLRQLPSMLLDPLGPLVFELSYLPHIAEWGTRLLRSTHPAKVDRAIAALASLNRDSVRLLAKMAADAGAESLIEHRGGLDICRDAETFRTVQSEIPRFQASGIGVEAIDSGRLQSLEPELASGIAGALLFPNSAHCTDLPELGRRFASSFAAQGTHVRAKATRLQADAGGWVIHCDRESPVEASQVVVCAGYASDALLAPLGYRVPLASARGYHLMLPEPGIAIDRPMIFHEPHFAATPMRAGLRLAGTMEFARADAVPNLRRAEMLFNLARRYLPNIRREGATTWMGVRPSMPDSLPAIGRASRHRDLFYSFGHGHLGLTQSAVSARALADIMLERPSPINLAPFDLARFQ